MTENDEDPGKALWKVFLFGALFVGVMAGLLSPGEDQPPFGPVFGAEVGLLLALVLTGAYTWYRCRPRRGADDPTEADEAAEAVELNRALHADRPPAPPADPARAGALARLVARRRDQYRHSGQWILVFGTLFLVDAGYRALIGDWLHASLAAGAGALAPVALVRMRHLRHQLDALAARLPPMFGDADQR